MKKRMGGLHAGLTCLLGAAVMAEDGRWTTPLGGLWGDTANGDSGRIATQNGHAACEVAAPNGATVRLRQTPIPTDAEIIAGGTMLMIR